MAPTYSKLGRCYTFTDLAYPVEASLQRLSHSFICCHLKAGAGNDRLEADQLPAAISAESQSVTLAPASAASTSQHKAPLIGARLMGHAWTQEACCDFYTLRQHLRR